MPYIYIYKCFITLLLRMVHFFHPWGGGNFVLSLLHEQWPTILQASASLVSLYTTLPQLTVSELDFDGDCWHWYWQWVTVNHLSDWKWLQLQLLHPPTQHPRNLTVLSHCSVNSCVGQAGQDRVFSPTTFEKQASREQIPPQQNWQQSYVCTNCRSRKVEEEEEGKEGKEKKRTIICHGGGHTIQRYEK